MSDDLQEMLKKLRVEYLHSFVEKTRGITENWEKKDYREVEAEFHKLKGSGRTYGLPEVSELGECMEKICRFMTQERDSAIPVGLALLKRIQVARLNGTEFLLAEDKDYKSLQSLLRKHGNKAS